MLFFKRWAVLAVLAVTRAVTAQNSSAITPLMVVGAIPQCAQLCIVSAIETANCSMTDISLFANCICLNEGLQADFNTCVQQSCASMSDWGVALGVEGELCAAYPKPDRTRMPIIATIVGIAIVIPCFFARLASRLKYTGQLWLDDYAMIITVVVYLGLSAILIVSAHLGLGLHFWNMKIENAIPLMEVMYVVVMYTGKLAILLLYLRLFNTSSTRWFSITVKVLLVLFSISQAIYLCLIILECIPISAIWDKSITNAKCLNLTAISLTGSFSSIITDVILVVLPLPVLWNLQVTRTKRIGLVFIFAVASLGTVASIVRLTYLIKLRGSTDDTWENVDVTVWSLIEVLCLIVCGSIPAVRPLLARAVPSVNLSISWQRGSKGTNKNPKPSQPSTGNSESSYTGSGSDRKSDIWLSSLPPANIEGPWKNTAQVTTAPRHTESQDRLYNKYYV